MSKDADKRLLLIDPSCHFCQGVQETVLHLLLDCPNACFVWQAIGIPHSLFFCWFIIAMLWSGLKLQQCSCPEVTWKRNACLVKANYGSRTPNGMIGVEVL